MILKIDKSYKSKELCSCDGCIVNIADDLSIDERIAWVSIIKPACNCRCSGTWVFVENLIPVSEIERMIYEQSMER